VGTLHIVADTAFDELLTRWRHHIQLRERIDANLAELGTSRLMLDRARAQMNVLRAAMYPTDSELEEVVVTTLCPSLGEVVHLNWTRRDPLDAQALQCVCGQSFRII
jgi:hypothetical protein